MSTSSLHINQGLARVFQLPFLLTHCLPNIGKKYKTVQQVFMVEGVCWLPHYGAYIRNQDSLSSSPRGAWLNLLRANWELGTNTILRGDWSVALRHEMRNFPNGASDDQIDALSLVFDELTDSKFELQRHFGQFHE